MTPDLQIYEQAMAEEEVLLRFGAGQATGVGAGVAAIIDAGKKDAPDRFERNLYDLSERYDVTIQNQEGCLAKR